jgi:hypothetical protein
MGTLLNTAPYVVTEAWLCGSRLALVDTDPGGRLIEWLGRGTAAPKQAAASEKTHEFVAMPKKKSLRRWPFVDDIGVWRIAGDAL